MVSYLEFSNRSEERRNNVLLETDTLLQMGDGWYGDDLDNEDKLPEDEEGNEYETVDLTVCLNTCVEEGGKERYCWRAGVMSRDEGGWRRELFVWTVLLCLKARSLLK